MTDMFDCEKANFSRLSGWGLPSMPPLGHHPPDWALAGLQRAWRG